MQGSLRRLPGMETVELVVMQSEHHKLPVLRAACCVGPNATIAAVKVNHSKISERWRCCTEADSQYTKHKSQLHYRLPYIGFTNLIMAARCDFDMNQIRRGARRAEEMAIYWRKLKPLRR